MGYASLIPNILTLFRIVSIPLIIVCFYIRSNVSEWIAVILFIGACLTDFLDGFIARRWGQISKLGQLLDPIADKLLIVTTILMLVGFDKICGINIIPAIIIVMREILVSGMREYFAFVGKELPVGRLSKFKTLIQMISLALFIISDAFSDVTFQLQFIAITSLWFAAIITAISGAHYLIKGLSYIKSDY